MPELIQPFILAAGTLAEDSTLETWLKTTQVQPRWLDEIVVASSSAELRFNHLPGADAGTLVYSWPAWQRSEHYLIQQASREIATGERRLILLVSEGENSTSALLLAAPAVIGYYNQLPQAYLQHLFVTHLISAEPDLLAETATQVLAADRKPEEIHALSLNVFNQKKPGKSGTPFESAGWVKSASGQPGAIAAMGDTLASLAPGKKKNGLVLELDGERNLYGIWIEKV
jgi:hypothetical protein